MDFLTYLPEELREVIETGRAAVVGGAIRCYFEGAVPTDVDVFYFSQEEYESDVVRYGAVPVEGTDGLVAEFVHDGMRIELVFQPGLVSVADCVAAADFDIASGVYSAGEFSYAPSFLEAIRTKTIRYLSPMLGAGSARLSYQRNMKYSLKYGYRIDASVQELLRRWREETA